jgi:hypothetical protein
VGSLESSVLPAARKLKELNAGGDETDLRDLQGVDTAVRQITKPELLGPGEIKH